MDILRIAAFSDGDSGGNPAGVAITDQLPTTAVMQAVAAEVGFSETAFASPFENGWRVRYFAPETEVPFCGHATIALGAALASRYGDGVYSLTLNEADITVEGAHDGDTLSAALQSPPTHSKPADAVVASSALALFGYREEDLNPDLPLALIHAGANHLVIGLRSRELLRAMSYDFDSGRKMMQDAELVTITLCFAEAPQLFHTRNPFASGGVYEDPATGAATAALAGYLRDIDWPHHGAINVIQGEDMGSRSLLSADIPVTKGSSIRVSGTARFMVDA